MILNIDTTKNNRLKIALKQEKKNITSLTQPANRDQAEKLLPMIDQMLAQEKITLKQLDKIVVNNGEGSFTSLRIGISTANALGYALGIPVEDDQGKYKQIREISLVIPRYSGDPDITKSKKDK